MDRRRRHMDGVARFHLALHQFVPFLDLEQHTPGPQEDGLVLLVVVLQAQRMAGLDVNQLADVPVRLRPVQLVSPGFLYACRFMHALSFCCLYSVFWTRSSLSRRDSMNSVNSFSTSLAVAARSAFAATRAASATRNSLSACLATGMALGAMLNSRSPRPTSKPRSTGSAAISPHT